MQLRTVVPRGKAERPDTLAKLLFRLLLVGLAVLAVSPRWSGAVGSPSPVAIVVNPSTPIDGLTLPELRKIMLGDRQYWPSNIRIVLLVRAPVSRERTVVLHTIYQKSEAQFRQYWIAKIFRAETTAGPKVVFSAEMTEELLLAIPGSIGFIDASKAQGGAKVLRIDGKLPGEKGYPLQ